MPTLRTSPPSPFGRKVKIGAALCGLKDRLRLDMADTMSPDDTLRRQNPLGKIPTLVLEDGTALYDSRVILEWLDAEAGGGVILPSGPARFPALTLQALADGVLDASILLVYERRFRPEEKHHRPWMDYQAEKVARALSALEAGPPPLDGAPHVGHIALACALGYRDFAWLEEFEARVPSFAATRPTG
jgi:glutathione S-transferase